MIPQKIVNCINVNCKKTISNSFNLVLRSDGYDSLHYVIEGTSYALNDQEIVKVLNWFDVFWLFLEITFKATTKKVGKKAIEHQILISLSVFQGEDSDNEKCQLFRAEWADYNNPEEKHAQPHWHITSSRVIENSFAKHAEDLDQRSFLQLLKGERKRIFDIGKIHFAMNADWQSDGAHVHKIEVEDEKPIVNWLQGLLFHLRRELQD